MVLPLFPQICIPCLKPRVGVGKELCNAISLGLSSLCLFPFANGVSFPEGDSLRNLFTSQ